MASSTHPKQSSSCTSADVDQCSLNSIRPFESTGTAATWNGLSTQEQRSVDQAAAITHRLRQLKVHIDINTAPSSSSCATIHQDESLAEEQLIERLEEVINEFMTRPNRHYSYNTTLHWTVDHGNQINYSVVILIHPPSD
jgi:hypothetical protein